MTNKTIKEFLDVLGSNASVPGGGGASALVGAVGAALGTMVGELTTGKKKYAEHQDEIEALILKSRELTDKLAALVQADADVFFPLSQAYKMPKNTPKEAETKNEALQAALGDAIDVPMQIALVSLETLKVLDRYSAVGSILAVSDAGTGAAMCLAAVRGARLNVLINIKSLDDKEKKEKYWDMIQEVSQKSTSLAEDIYSRVEQMCMPEF